VALIYNDKKVVPAKKFLEYLASPEARKVFEKYGFITKA
jgi:ABC-type molybdate transport system substrate-binding protein